MKGLQLPKYQIDHKKGKEQILNKEMNTEERQRLRSRLMLGWLEQTGRQANWVKQMLPMANVPNVG
jgi:hypothetical protein